MPTSIERFRTAVNSVAAIYARLDRYGNGGYHPERDGDE